MKLDRFIPLPVLVAVVFWLLLSDVRGQNRIDVWTTDNGLPQNSVTGLTQSPEGYLWFTTADGLVRFDGVRFRVFNKANTPGITTNRMYGAFVDLHGRLWLHTDDGGILFYEKGVFHAAMTPDKLLTGLHSRFFNDPAGDVIFYVSDEYHARKHYHYQNGKFVPLEIAGLAQESQLVLVDGQGGLWFASNKELRRVKDGKSDTYDLGAFNFGYTYKVAYEDRQGGIWLAGFDSPKQFLLRIKGGKVHSFQLPSAPVSHLAEDRDGNLWLSVFMKGIYRIDKSSVAAEEPDTKQLTLVDAVDGISNVNSGHLCPNREGGMWVGTNKGLVRVLPQTFRVFSQQNGLPEDNAYPICEDSQGRIWAGIWNNSLVEFENGSFKTALRTRDTIFITSLFEDRSGRFWIGNIDSLSYLDHNRFTTFTERTGVSKLAEFSVISQDRDGNLWFGTSLGLIRFADGRATVITQEDGLPDDYIVALLPTSDGKMWVGTRSGLASIENGNVKAFTTADGLASDYIRSLYEDSDRALWIGSYDGGLTRFKDEKFSRFTMKEGLSSNGVFCILEDNYGWFWMNSNQGIYRVSKQNLNDFADGKTRSLNSISYNKQDGLLNIEGNGGRQPAGIKARDGKLWFPTAQGIAVVDPETVATNQLPPPVLIEEVIIDSNAVSNDKLQGALANRSDISVSPSQTNLQVDYTGLSFINSEQVKFKYRLEGLDKDWNEVGTRRTAYYSYLPSGEYTFHVIAANRDGVWNTEGARIRIRVLPPFYRTNWFILICLLVIGCLVWMTYQWRVRQLAARLDLQFEQRLAERTRIARELHDTLLQGFVSASMQLHVAAEQVAADSPAKPILGRVQELMRRVIDEGRNAVRGLRTTDSSLNDLEESFARIQQELPVQATMDFRVVVEGTPRPLHPIIRDEVYRIGREALVNAFRHSQADHIQVELEYTARRFRILVRDNGRGIDPVVLQSGREGHWGLSGMRERAEAFKSKLRVSSRKEAGTEVELIIPAAIAFNLDSATRPARWLAGFPWRKGS